MFAVLDSSRSCAASLETESPTQVPETQSAFHPRPRYCAAITRPNSERTRVSPVAVPQTQSAFHRRAR